MATSKTATKNITIEVPYGLPDITTTWVKDATLGERNYSDKLLYYTVTKRINNLWFAELNFTDIGSTEQDYVKRGNTVKIFSNNTLILKGRMQSVEYNSYNEAKVQVEGMASDMKQSQNNTTYTNTATNTIVTALIGSTMSEGTNTNFGPVTAGFDNENTLKGIADLADTVDYYWYESWGSYPYDTDYMNFHSSIGKTTSQYTFNASGATQNMEVAYVDRNVDKQCNYVVTLGYGDGVNQKKSEIYDATTIRSTLGSGFGAGSVTMYVADTSDFGASGSVWVGCENMGYSAKGVGSFTGITSGLAFLGSPNVYQSYGHDAGVAIYEGSQYTTTNPQADSSISDYGIIQKRFTDKRIIDQNALDLFGAKILSDKKDPVEMITITAIEARDVLDSVGLGDNITITDADADLSGAYKVVGMVFGFSDERGEYLDLELSNKRESFIDQVSKIEQDTERVNVYMQGATNIFALSEKENCDNSKPLNMRFYVPDEAISINSVKLKFTTQKFRAYNDSTQTSQNNSSPSPVSNSAEGFASEDNLIYNEWTTFSDLDYEPNEDTSEQYVQLLIDCHNKGSGTTPVGFVRVYDGTNYYPDSTGQWTGMIIEDVPASILISIPGNVNGKTLQVQFKPTMTDIDDSDWYITGNYFGVSPHTHNITMSFGVYEADFPGSPTMTVKVGVEGSESTITGWDGNSVTDGGTYSIDITDKVRTVGAGNWCNIEFTPNGNMRVEANAYVQIFIKST